MRSRIAPTIVSASGMTHGMCDAPVTYENKLSGNPRRSGPWRELLPQVWITLHHEMRQPNISVAKIVSQ